MEVVVNKTKHETEEKQANNAIENPSTIEEKPEEILHEEKPAPDSLEIPQPLPEHHSNAEEAPQSTKFSSKQSLNGLMHFINEHLMNTDFKNMNSIVKTIYDKITYLTENLEDLHDFREWDIKLSQSVNKFLNYDHLKFNSLINKLSSKLISFNEKFNRKICRIVQHFAVDLNINCDSDVRESKDVKINIVQWFPSEEDTTEPPKEDLESDNVENERKYDETVVQKEVEVAVVEERSDTVEQIAEEDLKKYEQKPIVKRHKLKKCKDCSDKKKYKKLKKEEKKYKEKVYQKKYEKKETKEKKKYDDKKKYKKEKDKEKFKKWKHSDKYKKKIVHESYKKYPTLNRSYFKRNYDNPVNISGGWVFELADGRNEWREIQKLRDWFFERAKSREEERSDDGYWQFARAVGRKLNRNDAVWYFRRSDARTHHRNEFSSDSFTFI